MTNEPPELPPSASSTPPDGPDGLMQRPAQAAGGAATDGSVCVDPHDAGDRSGVDGADGAVALPPGGPSGLRRAVRLLYIPAGAQLALLLVSVLPLFVIGDYFPDDVMDDAYIFVRYADHLIESGRLEWNVGEGPVYGATSLLHVFNVAVVRKLTPGDPARSVVWASLWPMLGFVVALSILILRFAGSVSFLRPVLLTAFVFAFAPACEAHLLLVHAFTGMDTSVALLYLAVFLILVKHAERRPCRPIGWVGGIWGALAFAARPELVVFAIGVPTVMMVLSRDAAVRRAARCWLFVTVGGLVLYLAAAWVYFGNPLPMSFYAKSTHVYGSKVYDFYARIPISELWAFAWRYAFLIIPAVIYVIWTAHPRRVRTACTDVGIAGAAVVFIVYHLTAVLPIMHYQQRFFVPVLPALALLACRGAARLLEYAASRWQGTDRAGAPRGLCVLVVIVALALSMQPVRTFYDRAAMLARGLQEHRSARFDIRHNYEMRWRDYWYRLDAFSSLGDECVIATTEVGYAAAMNPGKTVVDLSGLNWPGFLFSGFSSAYLFEQHRPDLIYLPHPDYERIRADLFGNDTFRNDYEVYSKERLGTRFGLAVRRDSSFYDAMKRIPGTVEPTPR